MGKQLVQNVAVLTDDGMAHIWYGPDYPANELTDKVAANITNPAAWGEGPANPFDFSDRTPQAVLDGPRERRQDDAEKPLDQRNKDELVKLADGRGIDSSGTKQDVLDRLQAAGVEG